MNLRLGKKWRRVSTTLSLEDQVEFLRDSLELYKKHPNHHLLFVLVLLGYSLVLAIHGWGLGARLLIVSGLAFYFWVAYKYFSSYARFAGRWYEEGDTQKKIKEGLK